ncbi:UDP-glucuronosyltransferase 1A9-like isoform X2 [Lineus longissimus]
MDGTASIIAIVATILAALHQIGARRVLLLPGPTKGHISRLASIGEGLAKRGHQVVVALHKDFKCPESARKLGVSVLYYGHHGKMNHGADSNHIYHNHFLTETLHNEFRQLEGAIWDKAFEACTSVLSDLPLFKKFKALNLDFVLVDGHFAYRCLYIVPHKLGVPYGSFTEALPTDLVSTLMTIPSFHPHQMSMDCRSPDMDFHGRFKNSVEMILGALYIYFKTEDNTYRQYSQDKPYVSLRELAEGTHLWILDLDPLLDFAYPAMPNVVYSGGINLKVQPLSLPPDLEEFANSADDGLIVVTFGSGLQNVPNHHADKMAQVFGKLTQKVIWRNQGKPNVKLPKNVKLMDMIPLEGLLHHQKTKLFISHCGPGGQNQAIFHGVPMLAFPVTGEQLYNAMRLEIKGIGIKLDFLNFTTGEFERSIRDIIEYNTSYSTTAKFYSQMLKDRPYDVHDTVMYWLEHVMQYGGEHLRSQTVQLTWYQLLLFDVSSVLAVAVIVISIATFFLIRILCRCCYRMKALLDRFADEKIKMD